MGPSTTRSRAPMALLAFLGHYPALRLFHGYRLHRRTLRMNVLAAGGTLAAMVGAWLALGEKEAALAWLLGHLAWGSLLALKVLRGTAGTSPAEK